MTKAVKIMIENVLTIIVIREIRVEIHTIQSKSFHLLEIIGYPKRFYFPVHFNLI